MDGAEPRRSIELRILDPRIGKEFPVPAAATAGSAGIDLRACLSAPLDLAPGSAELIGTGIAIHLADPEGFYRRNKYVSRITNVQVVT